MERRPRRGRRVESDRMNLKSLRSQTGPGAQSMALFFVSDHVKLEDMEEE